VPDPPPRDQIQKIHTYNGINFETNYLFLKGNGLAYVVLFKPSNLKTSAILISDGVCQTPSPQDQIQKHTLIEVLILKLTIYFNTKRDWHTSFHSIQTILNHHRPPWDPIQKAANQTYSIVLNCCQNDKTTFTNDF
jgi:hypothetical protein